MKKRELACEKDKLGVEVKVQLFFMLHNNDGDDMKYDNITSNINYKKDESTLRLVMRDE